jgi:outer membrane protein OmpA-like peptidoglycan-associated protein
MKWFITIFFVISTFCSHAQIFKKILDKTKQKTEERISEKISEKASDAASKPIDDVTTKKEGKKSAKADENTSAIPGNSKEEKKSLSTYSKYDFVPGEKILVYEDFSQDAIGDFPDKWNTNGSGEVVNVEGEIGKWLKINKKGRFIPEFINNLPENFTLQFDLICNENFSFYSDPFSLMLLSGATGKAFEYSFIIYEKRSGVKIDLHPHNAGNTGGNAQIETFQDGERLINNDLQTTQFNAVNGNTKIRVSIWRQKQRIRVYLNEEKVFDLPRAFAPGKDYNLALFELTNGMSQDNDQYLFGNIKLAVGTPDTRSKLITEGKFVTSGILFDVNSDKIKPESFGVLKDIASVLKENPTVKIKIVGHTDSDGDDQANMDLSKKRSASVKMALVKEFGITEERIVTDGMGERQPVTNNNSPEAKANNRRVEFIKI